MLAQAAGSSRHLVETLPRKRHRRRLETAKFASARPHSRTARWISRVIEMQTIDPVRDTSSFTTPPCSPATRPIGDRYSPSTDVLAARVQRANCPTARRLDVDGAQSAATDFGTISHSGWRETAHDRGAGSVARSRRSTFTQAYAQPGAMRRRQGTRADRTSWAGRPDQRPAVRHRCDSRPRPGRAPAPTTR